MRVCFATFQLYRNTEVHALNLHTVTVTSAGILFPPLNLGLGLTLVDEAAVLALSRSCFRLLVGIDT